MTVEELNKKNLKLEDRLIKNYLKGIDSIEDEIYKLIQAYLKDFDTKNGKFVVGSKFNKDKLKKIRKDLQAIIEDTDFENQSLVLLDSFEEIEANIKAQHKTLNKVTLSNTRLNPYKEAIIDEIRDNLYLQNVDSNFLNPVVKAIRQRVSLGTNLNDTLTFIKNEVTGVDADNGKGGLEKHAIQVTRDAIGQYKGAINTAYGKEFNLKNRFYIGSIIDTSAGQCVRWVNKGIILYSQLQKEINWAYNNNGKYVDRNHKFVGKNFKGKKYRVAGMYGIGNDLAPKTTKETFDINRGHRGCRHESLPTNLKS